MKKIKIKFGDFWDGFNKEENYFIKLLKKRFEVELSENPDLLIFTHAYGKKQQFFEYKCHRLFLGWENVRADWRIADYVMDSDYYLNNPRHFRFPIWASWNLNLLTNPKPEIDLEKKKFASMVVSNGNAKERIEFFNLLSKYKKVDSGGRFLNNVGGPVKNKLDFIREYKFVISFENSNYPGYTTEKIIEPMITGAVPIYWGNIKINEDFNEKSFVNVLNFKSFHEAVDYIVELDKNDQKYKELYAEPWFIKNIQPAHLSEDAFLKYFEFVIEDLNSKKPVASSLTKKTLYFLDKQISNIKQKIS